MYSVRSEEKRSSDCLVLATVQEKVEDDDESIELETQETFTNETMMEHEIPSQILNPNDQTLSSSAFISTVDSLSEILEI